MLHTRTHTYRQTNKITAPCTHPGTKRLFCPKGKRRHHYIQACPSTTVCCVHHTPTPLGRFSKVDCYWSRQPRGCQYRTIRLRESLRETFPTPSYLAPTLFILFKLCRYRPSKIDPGGCDIVIYTILYTILYSTPNIGGTVLYCLLLSLQYTIYLVPGMT